MGAEQLTRIAFTVLAASSLAVVLLLSFMKGDRPAGIEAALLCALLAASIIPHIVELPSGLSAPLGYFGWILLIASWGVYWWTGRRQRRSQEGPVQ